jgi:hypothetical protein
MGIARSSADVHVYALISSTGGRLTERVT